LALKYVLDIFRPPLFSISTLDLETLRSRTRKDFIYASMGRHALFHLLKSLDIHGPLLLPAYLCESVLESVRRLGIEVVFYDLDLVDLNASLESIDFLARKFNCDAVLVASMYGNPAELTRTERYCAETGLILIDDAAQSFGSALDGRPVGSFGNGGFFSFSPGKPTAGHMGAFLWSEKNISINRTRHDLYHRLAYYDFYFNRLYRYRYRQYKFGRLFSLLRRGMGRVVDVTDDDISDFENEILGGILKTQLNGGFGFRQKWAAEFNSRFAVNNHFRVIHSVRGDARPHKLVALCNDANTAEAMIKVLDERGIFALNGYGPLTDDFQYLPNLERINGCVVELPIEDDETKMNYLFDALTGFVDQ
jgi:hypothetical protein